MGSTGTRTWPGLLAVLVGLTAAAGACTTSPDADDDAGSAASTSAPAPGSETETDSAPAAEPTVDVEAAVTAAAPAAEEFGEPVSVALASPEEPAAVVAYFDGPGAPFVTFLRSAEGVWDAPAAGSCDDALEALDAGAPPSQLVTIADESPDHATTLVLQQSLSTTVTMLMACDPDSPTNAEAAWAWVVAVRHLTEAGVEL